MHGFAGIGRGDAPLDVLLRKANRPETRRKWLACKVLIIDEVRCPDQPQRLCSRRVEDTARWAEAASKQSLTLRGLLSLDLNGGWSNI